MTSEDGSPVEALDLPRRRAVVLVVDLVESVRLMALDEQGVIARWRSFLSHVEQAVLPATAGRLVKSLGDGLMLEFATATLAVEAARQLHAWMSERCAPLADGSRLALRAGLHATDLFDAKIDIYGTGVNLAARIATLAEAGETVATVEARDELSDLLDADIEDLGECHLKHIAHPVRAYRLGPALQAESVPSQDSYDAELRAGVAVIPFSDAVPGTTGGLGDVIADGIIGQLSLSRGLRVVSRLSTANFRGREASLTDIARRLGVQYVVSGSYAVTGPRVSIVAELADAATGCVIVSTRVAGPWDDLLTIDSQLVHELADVVHQRLLDAAVSKAVVMPLPALSSCVLLLGGISMMHRANAAEFETSRRMLESLTERHRRIALPHAWLAKWYVLQSIQGVPGDQAAAAAIALGHTRRALDLEPSSALALAVEGFVHCHLRKDLDTAQQRLQEACDANPSEGFGWLFMAVLNAFKGDSARAVDDAHHALALSPMDPLRYYYESLTGSCAFSAGRFDEAIAWCERSHRRNRHHLSTLRILIAACVAADRMDRARSAAQALLRVRPGYTVAAYEARSVAALYPFGKEVARAMRAAGIP
jgi:class 3 adenylate cyclase